MWKYLRSLIKTGTGDSSKSFALVFSAIVGAIIGIVVAGVLIYDVVANGIVETNLKDLGWFLLCDGVFMFGGGLNKTLAEFTNKGVDPEEEGKEKE